ncbi:MAG TPA: ATP synthase subunit I [Aldersonia sp.]
MATPAPAPLMPSVPLSLKRPAIIVAVIGVLALAATLYIGRPLLGALIIVGMLLGLLNIKLVQRAVARVTAEDHPSKQRMAYSSASRLLIITAIALVIAFLLRPDGIGVFVGLAIFQVVLVLNTTVPVVKGLRQQS